MVCNATYACRQHLDHVEYFLKSRIIEPPEVVSVFGHLPKAVPVAKGLGVIWPSRSSQTALDFVASTIEVTIFT